MQGGITYPCFDAFNFVFQFFDLFFMFLFVVMEKKNNNVKKRTTRIFLQTSEKSEKLTWNLNLKLEAVQLETGEHFFKIKYDTFKSSEKKIIQI